MKQLSTKCPHFPECPSCTLKDPEHPVIFEELRKNIPLEVPLKKGKMVGWRYRAKLAVRQEGKNVRIGLFKKGSHSVVEIPRCASHHPLINKAVSFCKEAILESGVSGYEENGSGILRYFQFFVGRNDRDVQLTVVINEEKSWNAGFQKFLELIQKKMRWQGIWINFQPKRTNAIFSPHWKHYSGEKFIWQKIGKRSFAFHPAAFCQAHLELFETLIADVETAISAKKSVLELYAGIGTIGANIADKMKKVHLVERNPFSFLSFSKSSEKWTDIDNLTYQESDVASADLDDFEEVILDPPRKGVPEKILQKCIENATEKIIYVSCHLKSFLDDTAFLLKKGYSFRSVKGYLLFPGSNHIEILGVLEKESG